MDEKKKQRTLVNATRILRNLFLSAGAKVIVTEIGKVQVGDIVVTVEQSDTLVRSNSILAESLTQGKSGALVAFQDLTDRMGLKMTAKLRAFTPAVSGGYIDTNALRAYDTPYAYNFDSEIRAYQRVITACSRHFWNKHRSWLVGAGYALDDIINLGRWWTVGYFHHSDIYWKGGAHPTKDNSSLLACCLRQRFSAFYKMIHPRRGKEFSCGDSWVEIPVEMHEDSDLEQGLAQITNEDLYERLMEQVNNPDPEIAQLALKIVEGRYAVTKA